MCSPSMRATPPSSSPKMWEYREFVLRQIIACGGGNQYEQHRPLDVKKAEKSAE